jgi:hypothetical protein
MTAFDSTLGRCFRSNVSGAPFLIGQAAFVLCDDPSADERFHGRRGHVSGFFFDSLDEQFPHDPLILISVEGLGEEWFLKSEVFAELQRHARVDSLELASRSSLARPRGNETAGIEGRLRTTSVD